MILRMILIPFFLIIFIQSSTVSSKFLAGVTIKSLPFVDVKNNTFSGFCVDLMNLICDHSGLNYSLYLIEDGTYGPGQVHRNGQVSGLIGDVYKKKADFAIADLTVTSLRARYVNFTEPFLTFSFSALVRRSLAKYLQTMDDLALKSNLTIGTFFNGKTMLSMQMIRNEIRNVRWLYNQILKDESNMVNSIEEALFKVYNEPFAFIQEEPKNLYYSSLDCNLKTLNDQNMYVPGEYAIALHNDSPYIDDFNKAIKIVKRNGQMKRLIKKHFYNSKCRNMAFSKYSHNNVSIEYFTTTILSITIYLVTYRCFLID